LVEKGGRKGYITERNEEVPENGKESSHSAHSSGINRVKEERNVLRSIKRRKAKWIGHSLLRNCLLKHGFEGHI